MILVLIVVGDAARVWWRTLRERRRPQLAGPEVAA
jgi:hypothetical protein